VPRIPIQGAAETTTAAAAESDPHIAAPRGGGHTTVAGRMRATRVVMETGSVATQTNSVQAMTAAGTRAAAAADSGRSTAADSKADSTATAAGAAKWKNRPRDCCSPSVLQEVYLI
jgi:hypothetical protein